MSDMCVPLSIFIPERCEASNPESRDSGSRAQRTIPK
jgi:hypothetical protein